MCFRVVLGATFLVLESALAIPCAEPYGTSSHRAATETAMHSGSAADVVAAINAAKEYRGADVGCPEQDYPRATPNPSAPSLQTVSNVWQTVHAPRFSSYSGQCPSIGREWPMAALGAYYAGLAGHPLVSLQPLEAIADDMIATQFTDAVTPAVTWEGCYAYAFGLGDNTDPCYRGGIMDSLTSLCAAIPELCVDYTGGKWSGRKFVVGDIWMSPQFYDGGIAYDHAIAGVMMLEAALHQKDPALRQRFLDSALLAGEWSIAEPPVRNHNYTAKNIWLLAELYGLTGNASFKNAMLDKIDRNLIPGVLTDWNKDGLVDGMTSQPFIELWEGARRPGRNWDGHNALLWYGCMNATAMVEAYVALRDSGDSAEAARLRPYVIIMLDNLAWELNNLGPLAFLNVSMHSIPYTFLLALWKVAAYENDPHPQWEQAAWVMWNTGYPTTNQNFTAGNVGMYMLYLSGASYTPLHIRAQGSNCPECQPSPGSLFKPGQTACLAVPGDHLPGTTFAWSKDNGGSLQEGRYLGVNCSRLQILDLQPQDSGTYRCEYEGSQGKPFTAEILVTDDLPLISGKTMLLILVFVGAASGVCTTILTRRRL